jgi:serine dehydrogenase proteinase
MIFSLKGPGKTSELGEQVAYAERLKLIAEIEQLRNSKVICYLTSVRQNSVASMADDAVREMFDHLLLLPARPVPLLDIFLCSNGGHGTVPWRLVSLFREFADRLAVLVPYRAYSAATMLALGADEIIMGPFGEMGPIDPTVENAFNPIDPNSKQRIGISVEDVKAYVSFVKDAVGIRHEDELVKTIEILANQVHPLALGNVERFVSQSRLIARKILLTHMKGEAVSHEMDEIIETLASKLYFHGHPINRKEAREELKLKVAPNVPPALESAMWKLYQDYEAELENKIPFDPMSALFAAAPPPAIVPNQLSVIPPGTAATMSSKLAYVESARLSSVFETERRFVVAAFGQQGEPIVRSETLKQEWRQELASEPAAGAPHS